MAQGAGLVGTTDFSHEGPAYGTARPGEDMAQVTARTREQDAPGMIMECFRQCDTVLKAAPRCARAAGLKLTMLAKLKQWDDAAAFLDEVGGEGSRCMHP